jgi:cbb3-type cytochrome c oxidase subunit II
MSNKQSGSIFEFIEKNSLLLGVSIFVLITIGGIVEVVPSFTQNARPITGLKPYSALELAGRQIYIRESCNACHSQLIRPFKAGVQVLICTEWATTAQPTGMKPTSRTLGR